MVGVFKGRAHFRCQPLRRNSVFDFQPCFSGAKLPGNTPKMVAIHSLNLETVKTLILWCFERVLGVISPSKSGNFMKIPGFENSG